MHTTHFAIVPLMQRRCYWMLDGDDSIVLVHYLAANAAARLRPLGQAAPLTAANLAMQVASVLRAFVCSVAHCQLLLTVRLAGRRRLWHTWVLQLSVDIVVWLEFPLAAV